MHGEEECGGRLAHPRDTDEDDVGLVVVLRPEPVVGGEREVDGVEPVLVFGEIPDAVEGADLVRGLTAELVRELVDEVVEQPQHEGAALAEPRPHRGIGEGGEDEGAFTVRRGDTDLLDDLGDAFLVADERAHDVGRGNVAEP